MKSTRWDIVGLSAITLLAAATLVAQEPPPGAPPPGEPGRERQELRCRAPGEGEEIRPPEAPPPGKPGRERQELRRRAPDGGEGIRPPGGKEGEMMGLERVLNQLSPEERQELLALRQDNPAAFRERIQAMTHEMQAQQQGKLDKIRDLVKQLRESPDNEGFRQQLHDLLEDDFSKRLAQEEQRLERIQAEQQQAKDRLAKRRAAKEAIISKKMDELLIDPNLRWQ